MLVSQKTQEIREPSPIRHNMTVRLPVTTYNSLVEMARAATPRSGGSPPKLAEFVRILLASGLLADETVAVRTGAALVANLTLSMSGRMMEALNNLRDGLATAVANAVGTSRSEFAAMLRSDDYQSPSRQRPDRPDLSRVHLTLDEWLYRALVLYGTRYSGPMRSRGATAVKDILAEVLGDYASHEPVVDAYVAAVSRLRGALNRMVQDEQATILRTLGSLGRV